jgi:hypothetical protein
LQSLEEKEDSQASLDLQKDLPKIEWPLGVGSWHLYPWQQRHKGVIDGN